MIYWHIIIKTRTIPDKPAMMRKNLLFWAFLLAVSVVNISCSSTVQNRLACQWNVTSYANPIGSSLSLTTVSADEKYTLQFQPDGFFSFTTDCNVVSGRYSVKKNQLRFISPSSTEMACDKEMVERCIKSSLPIIVSYDLPNDSTLRLLGSQGNALIELVKIN